MGGLIMRPVEPGTDRAVDSSPDPSFLIVGTARSGTTLVQRLACSLEGVRVPPETHFRAFMKPRSRRESFPLDENALRATLAEFSERKVAKGLTVDIEGIVSDLKGRCSDPWQLFAALVRGLAGPAQVYGEKTPEHLRWWRPMTRHFPSLRLVAVVREPRAVVASNLQVPFGPRSHYLLAERWRADQRQLQTAVRSLPRERCMVIRYEDLVADPGAYRAELAAFLEVDPTNESTVAGAGLRLGWEWWKGRSDGPITSDRVEAWRETLTSVQALDIVAICRSSMKVFHYPNQLGGFKSLITKGSFSPSIQRARIHYRRSIRRELAWVDPL
jgi:hypothetical protein